MFTGKGPEFIVTVCTLKTLGDIFCKHNLSTSLLVLLQILLRTETAGEHVKT